MTSRDFFGRSGFRDVNITLYNQKNEPIYTEYYTSFTDSNIIIDDEIEFAIKCYREDWKYMGEPTRAEIWTAPKYNICTIDLITNKKTFGTL